MTRASYIVQGVVYSSNTALKRAWMTLTPELKKKITPSLTAAQDGGKVYLESDLAKWYIEAVFVTLYRRDQLKWTNLECALRDTRVFVARADILNNKPQFSKVRCIFFEKPSGHAQMVSSDPVDKKLNHRACINTVLRQAIADQIRDFRIINQKIADGLVDGKKKKLRCAICHGCINGESHVDHGTGKRSFEQISAEFLKTIVPAGSLGLYNKDVSDILDKHLSDWQEYHHKHARLKMTHSGCNLRNK